MVDIANKIGPPIKSLDELYQMSKDRKSVFSRHRALPAAVIIGMPLRTVADLIDKGLLKYYDKNGGFNND